MVLPDTQLVTDTKRVSSQADVGGLCGRNMENRQMRSCTAARDCRDIQEVNTVAPPAGQIQADRMMADIQVVHQ